MSSPLGGLPPLPMFEGQERFTPSWAGWLSIAWGILFATSSAGTTAARPTVRLYPGQFYFDTDLGKPIWVKTAGAAPVWVDATGAAV